jgi:hypothetical protein
MRLLCTRSLARSGGQLHKVREEHSVNLRELRGAHACFNATSNNMHELLMKACQFVLGVESSHLKERSAEKCVKGLAGRFLRLDRSKSLEIRVKKSAIVNDYPVTFDLALCPVAGGPRRR